MPSKICDNQYVITRINKESGRRETIIYTGRLRDKPTGWKVIQTLRVNGKQFTSY